MNIGWWELERFIFADFYYPFVVSVFSSLREKMYRTISPLKKKNLKFKIYNLVSWFDDSVCFRKRLLTTNGLKIFLVTAGMQL